MIDLHCHILPNVDDGPSSLAESLAVARLFVADGITHVTATPHCHRYLRLLREDILPAVNQLNWHLGQEKIPLKVFPGAEIQVTEVSAYQRDYEAGVLCHLGDNPAFSLTEFPWQAGLYPDDAAGLIAWLMDRGTRPIIAHPERHDYFRKQPDRLKSLTNAGAWIQITVDSLLDKNGPAARAAAESFLAEFPDAVLSTDSHSPQRCSGLSIGYATVSERLGSKRAADLRERSHHVLQVLLRYSDESASVKMSRLAHDSSDKVH
jgi:protein-tyrosine phosphatase